MFSLNVEDGLKEMFKMVMKNVENVSKNGIEKVKDGLKEG